MRWKVLLGVFLIILIAALLYSKPLPGWMPLKLPKVTLPSSLDVLTNQLKPNRYYNVILQTNKKSILGQKFSVLNTTLKVKGICVSPLTIGDTNMNLVNKFCNITIYGPNGKISITKSGDVILNSKFKKIMVNGILMSSPNPVAVEIIPSKLLGSISSDEIELDNYQGEIQMLSSRGEEYMTIKFPNCRKPKLYNFIGTINLNAKSVILSGVVSKIDYWCPNA